MAKPLPQNIQVNTELFAYSKISFGKSHNVKNKTKQFIEDISQRTS